MSEANDDSLQRIVGTDVPPTGDAGRWERSKSPWHADAFPPEFKDGAPEQGDRKTGWLEIDWCGNAIGWVPDGTVKRPNTAYTVECLRDLAEFVGKMNAERKSKKE